MFSPANFNDHFAEMPAWTWLRAASTKIAGYKPAKLQEPPADSFIRNVDATLGEHLLYITE
jgi:hypothetical protein